MALTDTALRNTKPRAKPYKLADGKGLFLLVQPSGGMLWRMKYRVNGRDEDGSPKRVEKKLGLGAYPEISLKAAREARDKARTIFGALFRYYRHYWRRRMRQWACLWKAPPMLTLR